MSYADLDSLHRLTAILGEHDHLAYAVLFLGAFFETLIPTSLLVMGEVFLLAGALLAGMGTLNVWAVLAVLYAGGLLGDNASYWLGRHFGASLFERLRRWPLVGRMFNDDNHRRGVEFFERHGPMAVFVARLSGPLSWITPAMAGVFRLNYASFLRFNTAGVIVGIGQFIIVGYYFGEYLPTLLSYANSYSTEILALLLALIAGAVWAWRRRRKARHGYANQ
jgi:membrane-associated protein